MASYTEKAIELFKSGCSCSQAVTCAFADKLEAATIATIESGKMTGDLALLYEGEAEKLNSDAFLDAIADTLSAQI